MVNWPYHLIQPSQEELDKNRPVVPFEQKPIYMNIIGNDWKGGSIEVAVGYRPTVKALPAIKLEFNYTKQRKIPLYDYVTNKDCLEILTDVRDASALLWFPSERCYLKDSFVANCDRNIYIMLNGVCCDVYKEEKVNKKGNPFWIAQYAPPICYAIQDELRQLLIRDNPYWESEVKYAYNCIGESK